MRDNKKLCCNHRQGSVLILSLAFMVVLLGLAALALDIGYLLVARTELQRSADAAAIASAWELIDEASLTGDTSMTVAIDNTRSVAAQYAVLNTVCTTGPSLDPNTSNAEGGDIVVGTIADLTDPDLAMTFADPSSYNAVEVRVRRNSSQNGDVPFFFAPIFGSTGAPAEATATAGFYRQVGGFKTPAEGNLGILPFACDLETWITVENNTASDTWSWDDDTQSVIQYLGDGISEFDLFPLELGSPGNRGTVNIGGNNNSTARISRQILYGITPADLAYHGGSIEFDGNGDLMLGADPGISAGFKDELQAIIGQPRVIPIFSQMSGNGNNAVYTIVKFVGVRVLSVKLTGNPKSLIVQPANVVVKGIIPTTDANSSAFVYSPPYLIR